MSYSKILLCLCLSFIAGVFVQSIIKIPQSFLWGFLFLGVSIIFAFVFLHKNGFVVLGFCLLFFVFGIIRLQLSEFNFEIDKLRKLNDSAQKINLAGEIVAEPDIRDSYQRLRVKIDEYDSAVLVTVGRQTTYRYLDKIRIKGLLKTPAVFEQFNYKNYLLKDSVYSVMDFPETKIISQEHNYNAFTFLYERILFLKERLSQSINSNFLAPQNSVLDGIVFGNDKNMPKDLKEAFKATGLSHLTAVSGGNILTLVFILMSLLLFLGFWRKRAVYLSLIFVWFYVVLVGLPASGVRAAIMASLLLASQIFGRQNNGLRAIVLAAALMLFENPFLLFYDVGFQLSFLASLGIIYLHPFISSFVKFSESFKKSKLKELAYKMIKELFDIVSITFSAQIFTLPIIIYSFGNVSLVAPLTNLLVLPVIPLLMPLGFLAALFGIFSNFLGWVFSLPCYLLLFYFLKIIYLFDQPWATKSFTNVSWVWPAIYYFVLLILIFYYRKVQKPKFSVPY